MSTRLGARVADAPRRLGEQIREDPGIAFLAFVTGAWFVVMELAIWRRHDRYGSFDQDVGFHVQFIWQLARGRSFSTILGLPAFGHNATIGYYLLVPLSWVGLDGVQMLDLMQTLVVSLAVIPIYTLARRRLGIGWPAVVIAMAWLLHPIVQAFIWETWHPEVIAATPLLCAVVAADDWRWRRYWLFIGLAIIWKTDVALFVTMLGLWVAVRRNARVGKQTIALGAIWFVAASIMIPHNSGGGTAFGALYNDLGDTPAAVVFNSVAHPHRLAHHVANAKPIEYGRDLLAPYGFVPLIAPVAVVLALPQLAINILPLDTLPRKWVSTPHYQALPLVALTLALIEAIAWLHRHRRGLRDPACAVLLACGLATSVSWGSLPFGVRWGYYWSEDGDPSRDAKDTAVAMIPAGAPVSAHYLISGHLARRELIYTFPNPWVKQYYGLDTTPRADPAAVQWVLLDEAIMSDLERGVESCIVASRAFTEVLRDHSIVVLHRLAGAEATDVGCT